MCELGVDELLDINSLPLVADKQVLIGRKRLDALGEALDEIFGMTGDGLVSDGVNDAEHVFGAMIDFAHEEMLFFLALPAFFLALLAFGDVLDGADETYGPSLAPAAL